MKRVLKEPLVHFVLLGSLVFLLDGILRDQRDQTDRGEIVVSAGHVENLAAVFSKTWQRPPTADELRALVDDSVLEEALYREGVALGVDQDDTIIRRRVRQKMDFVMNDLVELAKPTEAELEAWFEEHVLSYTRPARLTFRQVYLNSDRRGDRVQQDAARLLAVLRSNQAETNPRDLGDVSLLNHAYADDDADAITRAFGGSFAESLSALPIGEWSGPVESGFGLHLVAVDARRDPEVPSLAEVRDAVVRDWSYAQREAASESFYQQVVSRYGVTIEWPDENGPNRGRR